ncbi:hypothetical protein ALC60_08227 [Trachymyrmex zeteki]|uniref:Uncharacterized protein n=1 Tax=Mycetomoellerius zeteki TaxID=64791 RepID=A0A151WXF8_9HYME|nr:hypothetical protein ALC60_08227 [Trachymyrmex zeteki]
MVGIHVHDRAARKFISTMAGRQAGFSSSKGENCHAKASGRDEGSKYESSRSELLARLSESPPPVSTVTTYPRWKSPSFCARAWTRIVKNCAATLCLSFAEDSRTANVNCNRIHRAIGRIERERLESSPCKLPSSSYSPAIAPSSIPPTIAASSAALYRPRPPPPLPPSATMIRCLQWPGESNEFPLCK